MAALKKSMNSEPTSGTIMDATVVSRVMRKID